MLTGSQIVNRDYADERQEKAAYKRVYNLSTQCLTEWEYQRRSWRVVILVNTASDFPLPNFLSLMTILNFAIDL